MAAKEVNQLTEWWREPTHHPWKAGDPQSRNAYPEGFMVPARLWPGEGRTSSGIRERVFFIPLFVLVAQGHQGKDWQTIRRGF